MISRIVEACARNRTLVLFLAVVAFAAGIVAMRSLRLDAIPDLSDPQVIVFTEWRGRSPTLVEDQVTYPLVSALLSSPHVVDVRGQSMFGMSFVYVVFDEGTDLYWGRSRVLEALSTMRSRLPEGVEPRLGPDASGIGWVYQYALVDRSGRQDLGALRALQDSSLRNALSSVPGVAEVATIGGFEPQYQVTVDPVRLRSHGVTLEDVARAIRRSNDDVGGRVVEMSEREYYVRGRGYIGSVSDLESIALGAAREGTSLRIRDIGSVHMGGEIRRGAGDLDGRGETVSGIVVMRHGENALELIRRVETKLDELRPTLPSGVEIVTVYDRSDLVERAIQTLQHALGEELAVVSFVILLFLLHPRSALLPILSLPLTVVVSFIPMAIFGIPATIMSLGGIAIAIGATVDAEIVMVEACHKRLEGAPVDLPEADRRRLLADAAREVTPAIFFSLLIIAVSFLPVFGLTGQAGRLFRPLAIMKTLVMLSAALVSITVGPALRDILIRGRIRSEKDHPVSRAIRAVYEPFVHVALRNPATTVLIGVLAVVSALPLIPRLGTEFMPDLDEADILYMPTTLPNISIEEARRQLGRQDAILRGFPEVERVYGKIGRADTPTDPAPMSMVETLVRLRPRSEWGTTYVRRWYVGRTPAFLRPFLDWLEPEFVPKTREQLVTEMNARLQLPGFTNAFTQPIRNRVDMLTTGIRTPVGIKVYGRDLDAIERAGTSIERLVRDVDGTRSVLFERATGGLYIDVVPDREALGRVGLTVGDVNDVIETALGGVPLTTTVEGRNRFTVNLRYAEEQRSSLEAIRDVLVPIPTSGAGAAPAETALGVVPLGTIADVRVVQGPPMIRDEAGLLVGYVYVDVDPARDLGSYVSDARAVVGAAVSRHDLVLPAGGYVRWTGQYELLQAMEERMAFLIPISLLVTILLLYLQFRNFTEVLIVLLSVPFALVGSVWALFLLGYHVSTAVWVGLIAMVGLAAQTGVVMIVYIDHAYERRLAAGRINSLDDIIEAHAEGTIERVRPKLMTVGTMLFGLVPLLWAEGSGADVMRRIAAPMVGGLITSAFLTLEIIPVIYTYWRNEQLALRTIGAHSTSHRRVLDDLVDLIRVGVGASVAFGACSRLIPHAPRLLGPASASLALVSGLFVVAYVVMRRTWLNATRNLVPVVEGGAS